MSITFTDIFCGAGGSSIGLAEAGFELALAANHWPIAIRTHAANFPDAEHLCADVNNYDMRRLPTTDIGWFSPICTEASPSGAGAAPKEKYQRVAGQVTLDSNGEPMEQAGFERTRATFYDVLRATEVHHYKAVLIENVPEVAWKWGLYEWFLQGLAMVGPGYNIQIVCVSSAHIGGDDNPFAPQWRNRKYIVATRKDLRIPDVEPRPLAWCGMCASVVRAKQWWKPKTRRYYGFPIGKYRSQYLYQCPTGHAFVEPYVLPAAAVIDWSNLGERLGDRDKMPVKNTLRRIEAGLKLVREAALITVNHSDSDHRAIPLAGAPFPTRTVKIGDGVATHPLLVPCGGSRFADAADAAEPFRPRLTRESEAVLAPPAFIAEMRNNCYASAVDEPVSTLTTSGRHHYLGTVVKPGTQQAIASTEWGRHALVVPYRRNNKTTTTAEPLLTMATKDPAALATPARDDVDIRIEDCHFRMLTPREQLRAQRFPDSYQVFGTVHEQTMQAGNAVSSNVAHWLGRQVMAVLS
jgi:DNA (cytosine-5)-methyltransferase 1